VFTDDIPISVKFGMLTTAETIRALTTSKHLANKEVMKVLDPVMISTSGHTLLPDDAIEALKDLFGVVDWLTPNIPEAQRLSGLDQEVTGAEGLVKLAKKTAERCNVPIVLLKGGHHPISRDQVRKLGEGYRVSESMEKNCSTRQRIGQGGFGYSCSEGDGRTDVVRGKVCGE
jgi:hydroxymethylpyrimidine/phosphomethylpyrimidine kinase